MALKKRKSKSNGKREPTDRRIVDLQQQRLSLRHELCGKVNELNRQILGLRSTYGDKIQLLDAAISAVKDGKPVTVSAALAPMPNDAPLPPLKPPTPTIDPSSKRWTGVQIERAA
jgi:hypothetical protein